MGDFSDNVFWAMINVWILTESFFAIDVDRTNSNNYYQVIGHFEEVSVEFDQ